MVSMLNQAAGIALPDAGRRLLCLSVGRGADRQDDAPPASRSPPTRISRRAAGSRGRGGGVWRGVRLSPFFRISYATSNEALEEACKRIQRFCANVR